MISFSVIATHLLAIFQRLTKAIAFSLVGAAVVLLLVGVNYLNSRPGLSLWHEVELEEEFTQSSPVATFEDYMALEERLFEELDRKVYKQADPVGQQSPGINRYHPNSRADPRGRPEQGNRTSEWKAVKPKAGVLLLHGMSDSPYSLRSLGETLHAQGAHVIGLRLPGHGTAPSGLTSFVWEDMDAAVRIAMRHLRDSVGDRPLFLVGYSNGGALSVHYALQCLKDQSLPKPEGIVLISPAIGVTPMAAFAVWQKRIGQWSGLEKLAWSSILPEYDPYKYVSFPVNAGYQVRRLTIEIGSHLGKLEGSEKLKEFPRVIAFQSVVDATVSAPTLVEGLFAKLPVGSSGSHELILFDVNRAEMIDSIMNPNLAHRLKYVAAKSTNDFTLTVLTNRNSGIEVQGIEVRTYRNGLQVGESVPTNYRWPRGIYSLSHVSLPFSPFDEIYGKLPITETDYRLGMIALRGEHGVVQISPGDQLRLRWNPFYDYLSDRTVDFVSQSFD